MGRKRPRRRPAGILDEGVSYLPTAHARWQLLVGEESAVPAILGILEKAHPDLKAEVFLEVPSSADIRHDIIAAAPPDDPTLPGANQWSTCRPSAAHPRPVVWCTATVLG
jgi:NADPH-dependent ferric siderophore reductase